MSTNSSTGQKTVTMLKKLQIMWNCTQIAHMDLVWGQTAPSDILGTYKVQNKSGEHTANAVESSSCDADVTARSAELGIHTGLGE